MLVTFKTSAYADITMFGDVAESILRMMGQSGNVPGALMADDVAAALDALNENLQKADKEQASRSANDDVSEDEQPVALSHRAMPLIELLNAAKAAHSNVMWDN